MTHKAGHLLMHEALDRTHLMACMWQDFILSHPAVEADSELKATADQIGGLIGQLYQDIGNKYPDASEE